MCRPSTAPTHEGCRTIIDTSVPCLSLHKHAVFHRNNFFFKAITVATGSWNKKTNQSSGLHLLMRCQNHLRTRSRWLVNLLLDLVVGLLFFFGFNTACHILRDGTALGLHRPFAICRPYYCTSEGVPRDIFLAMGFLSSKRMHLLPAVLPAVDCYGCRVCVDFRGLRRVNHSSSSLLLGRCDGMEPPSITGNGHSLTENRVVAVHAHAFPLPVDANINSRNWALATLRVVRLSPC
ncbi:hypothetical protein EDB89DRAFT_1456961 [Lactarius sanguifluus]|nr:hypothetical protein EDB89DRAFT_1456961 [Lactarius sanguifluus]